jgi:hypothetical protein
MKLNPHKFGFLATNSYSLAGWKTSLQLAKSLEMAWECRRCRRKWGCFAHKKFTSARFSARLMERRALIAQQLHFAECLSAPAPLCNRLVVSALAHCLHPHTNSHSRTPPPPHSLSRESGDQYTRSDMQPPCTLALGPTPAARERERHTHTPSHSLAPVAITLAASLLLGGGGGVHP